MDFDYSPKVVELQKQVQAFMDEHIYPNEESREAAARGQPVAQPPIIEELKRKAKAAGLWNLFLPESQRGAGLTNLEYAPLCEIMGRSGMAPEVFNCAAPDTGNMEVLERYGTAAQQKAVARAAARRQDPLGLRHDRARRRLVRRHQHPLRDPPRRRRLRHQRPQVVDLRRHPPALQDPHRDGQDQPRRAAAPAAVADPGAARHARREGAAPPAGVRLRRRCRTATARCCFEDVRVPAANILLGEGRGFEIAQGRLGPGRIHHCMRVIGVAERALDAMCKRVKTRVAFGKPIAEQTVTLERIAESRIAIEQARLLTLKAAYMMDTVGNKVARKEIAMIKVAAPNMALKVIDWAIQAHGAAGVSDDFFLARAYANTRTLRLADGPDEVHRNQIGKLELREH